MNRLARDALALLPRLHGAVLAALVAVVVGTNLLDFLTAPAPGGRPGAAFVAAAAIRVALVFWVAFVVQRRLVEPGAGFAIGGAFWRFALLQLLLAAGMALVRLAVMRLIPPAPRLPDEWLVEFLGMVVWALLAIRLLAWNAALAAGAPLGELGRLWRGLRGQDGALVGAFAMLVLPPAALHLAFTLIAIRIAVAPGPLAFLGLVDGLVAALQLALTSALGAVALRLATSPQAR